MKVRANPPEIAILYEDLPEGEVFVPFGTLTYFLKVKPVRPTGIGQSSWREGDTESWAVWNCVRLDTAELCSFGIGTLVTHIEGEFVDNRILEGQPEKG
jgi:hypothetical protein